MNDAQAAPGASLLPDSTDIFTITVFVLIALFALATVAMIVTGARRKRRRVAAEETVRERIEQAEEAPPIAPPPSPPAVTREAPAPTSDEPLPETLPEASPTSDDPARGPVTQLKGLGPKVTARLAELGIVTVGDLAALSDDEAARLDAQLGPFAGRMARDRWLDQARLLAAGDRAGFEAVFGKL